MYAPIAWFLVFLLTLNRAGVRWIGFPKAVLEKGRQYEEK